MTDLSLGAELEGELLKKSDIPSLLSVEHSVLSRQDSTPQ